MQVPGLGCLNSTNLVKKVEMPLLHLPRLFRLIALVLAPLAAHADGHGTGSFAVVSDDGQTLMALDLTEGNGRLTGDGVIPEGGLAHGPGLVDVQMGARLGDNVQLVLRLKPHDRALPAVGARITIGDGQSLRLVYGGQMIDGSLLPLSAADRAALAVPAPPAPPSLATRAIQTAPAAPALAAPAPAAPAAPAPVPAPQSATIPMACMQLQQLIQMSDAAAVAEIDKITTLYGLGTGADPTEAKCNGALAEVTVFLEDFDAGDEAEACFAVTDALIDIDARLVAVGSPPNDTPGTIMTIAGMKTPDNPDGVNSAQTCAAALPELYDFLDNILAPVAETDAPDSYDLPAGYRIEPLVNLGLSGEWDLVAGGDQLALWKQGRSTLAYETGPGSRRVIWFWEPRPVLANAGVTPGTLYIEGTRTGGVFTGEARHYVAGCGAYVYPVSGRVREQETLVRFQGNRPQVSDDCRVTGVEPHNFRVEFQADNPPGTENLNLGQTATRSSSTPDFGVWALEYQVRNIDRGGALNIRRNPATNARIVGTLPHNARNIRIVDEGCTPTLDHAAYDHMIRRERNRVLSTRWCRVRWDGLTGWVYGRYLRPM